MRTHILDVYSDYLICSFSQASATRLSALLEGQVSHDQVTRDLSTIERNQQMFWRQVKPLVRQIESDDGVISIDDFISEKPDTDENEIVCYHFSHSKQRSVKGINIVPFVYQSQNSKGEPVRLVVAYEVVHKPIRYEDPKSGKMKRKSCVTKNELLRERLRILAKINQIKFKTVLMDIWYSASDNLIFIKKELQKEFICPIKSNRLATFVVPDGASLPYQSVETLDLQPDTVYEVKLNGVPFSVALIKHIYTNADGSIGVIYLISSDLTLTATDILTRYQKRWGSEECHKSLQQNVAIEKSPTKRVTTQKNHIFAAMIAYNKLETLKINTGKNQFALKNLLYIKAIRAAWHELQHLQTQYEKISLNPI